MPLPEWLRRLLRPRPVPDPVPVPVSPPGTVVSMSSAGFFEAMNRARAAHGLPPLIEDIRADNLATTFAIDMARSGAMGHGNHLKVVSARFPGRAVAENLARGQPDGVLAVRGWLEEDDPGHRRNLFGPYRLVGVGMAVGRDGTPYWVADFVG